MADHLRDFCGRGHDWTRFRRTNERGLRKGGERRTRGRGMGRWLDSERAPEKGETSSPAFSSSIVGGKLEWGSDGFGDAEKSAAERQEASNRRRTRTIIYQQAVIDRSYACAPATAAGRERGNRDKCRQLRFYSRRVMAGSTRSTMGNKTKPLLPLSAKSRSTDG